MMVLALRPLELGVRGAMDVILGTVTPWNEHKQKPTGDVAGFSDKDPVYQFAAVFSGPLTAITIMVCGCSTRWSAVYAWSRMTVTMRYIQMSRWSSSRLY